MGIFDFFSKIFTKTNNSMEDTKINPFNNTNFNGRETPEENYAKPQKESNISIPEDVFLEKREPYEFMKDGLNVGMDEIFAFLNQDLESSGYEDALNIPDRAFEQMGIDALKKRFNILLEKAILHYSEYLNQLDYHIESQKELGMLDLVGKLLKEKENVLKRLERITNEKQLCDKNEGLILYAISSYQKGFRKGLSIVTMAETGKYMKDYLDKFNPKNNEQ